MRRRRPSRRPARERAREARHRLRVEVGRVLPLADLHRPPRRDVAGLGDPGREPPAPRRLGGARRLFLPAAPLPVARRPGRDGPRARAGGAALAMGIAALFLIPSWRDLGNWLAQTLSELTGIPIVTEGLDR